VTLEAEFSMTRRRQYDRAKSCRVASRNFVTGCLIRDVTEPDVWLSPDLVVNRKAEGEEAMLTQVGAGNISAEAMTPAG
jgi:hypothetical protein